MTDEGEGPKSAKLILTWDQWFRQAEPNASTNLVIRLARAKDQGEVKTYIQSLGGDIRSAGPTEIVAKVNHEQAVSISYSEKVISVDLPKRMLLKFKRSSNIRGL